MRLFFDIGNTRLKWLIDDCLEPLSDAQHGDLLYKENGWVGLESRFDNIEKITSVWASSVASSEVESKVDELIGKRFGLSVNWLSVAGQQCGVENLYQPLSQLGVDRWAAVLGAKQYLAMEGLRDRAAIVIDAGTAVTVDVLTSDLVYQGGAIMPGLNMMHDVLVGTTQGIDSSFDSGLIVPGSNTQQCVNGGVHYALFGAVERLVVEMQSAMGLVSSKVVVILTGGDADLIMRNVGLECIVLPRLVVDGLRCVADVSEGR